MPLNKAKGRMFKSVGWTWNPIVGCIHNCCYCWAKALRDRWNKPFNPVLQDSAFKDTFPNDGSIIFIGSMGDLFCGAFHEDIEKIFNKIKEAKNQRFLLQTKNPLDIYSDWMPEIEDLNNIKGIEILIGTTIETNRDIPWSDAPHPLERFLYMFSISEDMPVNTFLSYEPLADFDIDAMITIARGISPIAIEIGLENYTNFLPKPPKEKIKQLIDELKKRRFEIILKDNLSHFTNKSEKK